MKFIIYVLLFLLLNISVHVIHSSTTQTCSLQQEKINQNELSFDELEEEAIKINAFATVENKPINPIMVWLRIIGSPLINAYFNVVGNIDHLVKWCQLYIKIGKDAYENKSKHTKT